MPDQVSHICRRILPTTAVRLGRLVTSVSEPLQGYHDLTDAAAHVPSHTTVLHDFSSASSEGNRSSVGAFLSNLINVSGCQKKEIKLQLEASKLTSMDLDGADGWFKEIMSQAQTREWIQECIETYGPLGFRIYLLVGLHLVENAKITVQEMTAKGASTDATVPLTALLGDPAGMIGNVLGNPGVSATLETSKSDSQSFIIEDIVFAIRYRRIKLKWFSSRTLSSSYYLDPKTSWKAITDERAGLKDEAKYDTIEAIVCDENDDQSEDDEGEEEAKERTVMTFTDNEGNNVKFLLTEEV